MLNINVEKQAILREEKANLVANTMMSMMSIVFQMLIVVKWSITKETHLLGDNDIQNIQTLVRPIDDIEKVSH